MDALGDIEIRIEGSVGARELTPAPAWENVSDADEWLEEIR